MNLTKVSDMLTGKNVWNVYCEYKDSQWFSTRDLDSIKLEKLKSLVKFVYRNVPFYTDYMNGQGIVPSDISKLEDIQLFPVLTKEVIKTNYENFTPINLHAIKWVKTSQTGGTTGNILLKRNDASSRSAVWGAFKRFEDWMGYRSGDKALILMGGHVIHNKGWRSFKLQLVTDVANAMTKQIRFNPYNTDPKVIENIITTLKSNDIKLIRSYSQYLFHLCHVLAERQLEFRVKSVTTTAEPLMQVHRDRFKDVLGAESYDQYGCGEIGGIAFECEKHEGLHVTEEHVIVEVNDNSELIVTDLDNYAMPFIRYWNADQAVVSSKKCSCGREHQLIDRILGRTCDYVTGSNGSFLHWAYFWHLVFDSGVAQRRNLQKFQIVQRSSNQLLFRYVAEELSVQEQDTFKDNIQSRLGDMVIDFVRESDIENSPSGKYRPVINETL